MAKNADKRKQDLAESEKKMDALRESMRLTSKKLGTWNSEASPYRSETTDVAQAEKRFLQDFNDLGKKFTELRELQEKTYKR